MIKTVHVPLEGRAYDVVIGTGLIGEAGAEYLRPLVHGRTVFIITDRSVGNTYLKPVGNMLEEAQAGTVAFCAVDPGEASKTINTVSVLYGRAVEAGLDRSSVVVALGGGVIGDTAGFMAATYMRGIDCIQIPTSLVAQVDSAVGGKTGVDLPEGKNLVGAFHQPKLVLADTNTLATLPERQLRCGLAEVAKYGLVLDAPFFDELSAKGNALLDPASEYYADIVERCCQLKADVVTADERDTDGRRAVLNYGHTFGHALERLDGYTEMTHGEAISIGMGMAADLAAKLWSDDDTAALGGRQDAFFEAVGLPVRATGFKPEAVLDAMGTDKKTVDGQLRLVLVRRPGQAQMVADIDSSIILEAIGGRCDT